MLDNKSGVKMIYDYNTIVLYGFFPHVFLGRLNLRIHFSQCPQTVVIQTVKGATLNRLGTNRKHQQLITKTETGCGAKKQT